MTPEQLLQPRVKCIADDTSRDFEVGEIFYADKNGEYWIYGNNGRWKLKPENYPHLFRKLDWWEDRSDEEIDIVRYVKRNDGICFIVAHRSQNYRIWHTDGEIEQRFILSSTYSPISQTEYLTYQNSLK